MPDDGDDDSLSSPRVDVVVVDDDIVALTFNDDDAEPDDDTDEAERELARFFGIVLHACDLCRNDILPCWLLRSDDDFRFIG